jgi:uncharacterized membrane protein YoaK (UPF0700 family)
MAEIAATATLIFGPSDLDAGRRVRFFTAVSFCFLAGAVLGARWLTPGIGNLALWPAALILLIVRLNLGWALWSDSEARATLVTDC